MPLTIPRVCQLEGCDVSLEGMRRDARYCCPRHYDRDRKRKAAKPRQPQPVKKASVWRQARRIKARIRAATPCLHLEKPQEVDLENPFGTYRPPALTTEELLERRRRSELVGLIQEALMTIGVYSIQVISTDQGPAFITDDELEEHRDWLREPDADL